MIENFFYSNFGTKSLLLKRRIDWYIKLIYQFIYLISIKNGAYFESELLKYTVKILIFV